MKLPTEAFELINEAERRWVDVGRAEDPNTPEQDKRIAGDLAADSRDRLEAYIIRISKG